VPEDKEKKTAGTGLPKNTTAALCYLLGWVTGLVFLLIEKDDKFVRFHAMQSIVTFGALNIAVLVPVIGVLLSPFIGILGFILWLVCMLKAYQGEKFKVPIAGDFAEKQIGAS
jgi:uncharacterized membrane protein